MKTSDFNYELPPELIAQTPIQRRDASRLLVLDKNTGAWQHRHFYDLPEYLRPGDCLILNNSRVLPARLLGHRLPGGGACEVLLLIDRGQKTWECLVRPGKRMRTGAKLSFGDGELTAEVVEELPGGNRLVRFDYEGIFLEVLEKLGKMPLPPYIKEELQDQERYQTVYSRVNGSAAAPTAGLHFTQGHLRGHPLLPHHRELGCRGWDHDGQRRVDGYFHLSRLPIQGHGCADHQFPPAGIHPDHAGVRPGGPGAYPGGVP